MISLAPWFYKNLLGENDLIEIPCFYEVHHLDGTNQFEALVSLKNKYLPKWLNVSDIYNNCDGAGTSQHKNIAVYKAISEALERWAFYVASDSADSKKLCFDVNPTTTGMAAYPGLSAKGARSNAILEAKERWALHEFWRGNLPVKAHVNSIQNLHHYEILTPFKNCHISLLSYQKNNQTMYAFAAEDSIEKSFQHALVELARNIRVMDNLAKTQKSINDFSDISDKRLFYFSTNEGYSLFMEKISIANRSIPVEPSVICDLEIKGEWNKYTKVWRYLYENSFPDSSDDYKFFMF